MRARPDWIHIVEAHHKWGYPNNEYQLVTQPPASIGELAILQSLFGAAMSEEIRTFYEQINGFGIKVKPGHTSWFVTPIACLPELIRDCRNWFHDTHPDLAERFFPFINWGCGDYSGILLTEDGIPLSGLFDFEHENYAFDQDQKGSEFLFSVYKSLEELLTPN